MRYLLFGLCLAFVGALSISTQAFAVSVYPEVIDISVDSASSTSAEVSIGNDSSKSMLFALSIREVRFSDDGSVIFGKSGPDWISMNASSIAVASADIEDVIIMVSPPSNLPAGIYVFAVIAQESVEHVQGIGFATGYASLLFVDVDSELKPESSCERSEFSISGRTLSVDTSIRNTGGGILYIETSTNVSSVIGSRVLYPDLPDIHRVVSGQTRVLRWDVQLPWWMFGPVRGDLSSTSCSGNTLLVFPSVSMMFVMLVMFGLPSIGYALWRRR